jgi:hypothetical protein
MDEERGKSKNPKSDIDNIDKLLPRIAERLSSREAESERYNSINERYPELKSNFDVAKNRYDELREELYKTNDEVNKLYLEMEQSWIKRFSNRIQQIWKSSKTIAFILIILVVMVIITVVAGILNNNDLLNISFLSGVALILCIGLIRSPKYRLISGSSLFALLLFSIAFYVEFSLSWTLIALGIAIIALGVTLHTFNSGEYVEQKVDKIEDGISEILNMLKDQSNNS